MAHELRGQGDCSHRNRRRPSANISAVDSRPEAEIDDKGKLTFRNVEVTGAARLYHTASAWTTGLCIVRQRQADNFCGIVVFRNRKWEPINFENIAGY